MSLIHQSLRSGSGAYEARYRAVTSAMYSELAVAAVGSIVSMRSELATLMRLCENPEEGCWVTPSTRAATRAVGVLQEGYKYSGWSSGNQFSVDSSILEGLLLASGVLDVDGNSVYGLPAASVGHDTDKLVGSWRGAILSGALLKVTPRTTILDMVVPNHGVALGLLGSARRMGVSARSRDDGPRLVVEVRGDEEVAALLRRLDAPKIAHDVSVGVHRPVSLPTPSSPTVLDGANRSRALAAAEAAAARVAGVLETQGDTIPAHLAEAGKLRVENPHLTLEELGRLAVPAVSKDTMAGRLRRLSSLGSNN